MNETKRTDLTPKEIAAAQKLGIVVQTPEEQMDAHWERSSQIGKVINLDAFFGLVIALVLGGWLLSVVRAFRRGDDAAQPSG